MTHTTDQERAEFEKAWRERPIEMGGAHQKEVAYIWWMQAARRAPAAPVPQGWRLVPVEPTDEMLEATSWPGCAKTDYAHMLAAAPQPPEAAPVELPELSHDHPYDCIDTRDVTIRELERTLASARTGKTMHRRKT